MSRTVVDAADLERRVKDMYTQVALDPHARYHFEMGRAMASRLGYTDEELDAAPAASIESFAGVGYYFGLANLRAGEHVVDLGSGADPDVRNMVGVVDVRRVAVADEGGACGLEHFVPEAKISVVEIESSFDKISGCHAANTSGGGCTT